MILASSRTTHESLVLSKPPACIHGISGYTHAKHEEHDTSCTATEASSWPIIFLRCQVINTAMLVVFWWSSWMIMDNHNFWEALGNSPNKETRRGNKAVFDNTVPYHIPSEITGHLVKGQTEIMSLTISNISSSLICHVWSEKGCYVAWIFRIISLNLCRLRASLMNVIRIS